jgi:putative phage-type endonuclease
MNPQPAAFLATQHPGLDDSWLGPVEDRSTGIGGSDVAAILGMHPHKDAMAVFCEKTGLYKADLSNNPRVQWGKRLERIIAEAYAEVSGRAVEWCDTTFRHPQRNFQLFTCDGLIPGNRRGLEVKTAGVDQAHAWGETGTDQVPEHYALQCHWYLSATDYEAWDIAVLIGGNDLRIFTIERDRELEQSLLVSADSWWTAHIEHRVPPAIDGGEGSSEYLKAKFPRNRAALREATEDEIALLTEYRATLIDLDRAEQHRDKLQNFVKMRIAEAEGLKWDGGKVTWRRTEDRSVTDWELVANHLGVRIPAPEFEKIIERYTNTKPGTRRFLATFKGEE